MKRRQFLGFTAGGIVLFGIGVGTGGWLFRKDCDEPQGAMGLLAGLAESMVGVAAVGRAWQQANAGVDSADGLLASLALEPQSILTHEEFVERLGAAVSAELEEARVFVHEGWWLSETEARLAALHVALLGPEASDARTPDFETAREGTVLDVVDFAPRAMRQGEAITHPGLADNVIWFGTRRPPPPRLRVMMAGMLLRINAGDRGFSVQVRDSVIEHLNSRPGDHEIWLYDPVALQRQRLGTFRVREAMPDESGFCNVAGWGPKETRAGEVFNEQADGASAFWVRTGCFPDETVLVMDGVELPTTLRPADGLITAHVADSSLYDTPGEYTVQLVDRESGVSQPVGTFVVNEP